MDRLREILCRMSCCDDQKVELMRDLMNMELLDAFRTTCPREFKEAFS